jgi:hypothetical protein
MNADRWNYLKALRPSPGRLVFNARDAAMIPNPALLLDPDAMPKRIPWIEPQGRTYNVGKNAAKRAARAQA